MITVWSEYKLHNIKFYFENFKYIIHTYLLILVINQYNLDQYFKHYLHTAISYDKVNKVQHISCCVRLLIR